MRKIQSKWMVYCFYYAFFVNGMLATMMGAILPMIKTEYHLSYSVSGMLLSGHSIGNLLASFIAGIIPAYLGRKRSIILFSLAICLGFATIICVANPLILIASFVAIGAGRGGVSNLSNVSISEISDQKAKSLNILHSIFAIGAFIAPLVAMMFTYQNQMGWRLGALTISALAIGSICLFLKSDLSNQTTTLSKESKDQSYEFLKEKQFWVCLAILFFYLCTETTINGWLVTYFQDTGKMTMAYAQFLTSLLWLVIMFGRIGCAHLSQRVKKAHIILITTIGGAICFAILIMAQHIVGITLGIIGVGLFLSGIYPTTIATLSHLVTKYPMAMGTLLAIGAIGSILMPSVTGIIAEYAGIKAGMASIGVVTMLTVIAAIINAKYFSEM